MLAADYGSAPARKFFLIGGANTDTVYFQYEVDLGERAEYSQKVIGFITFQPDSVRETAEDYLRVTSADIALNVTLREDEIPGFDYEETATPVIQLTLQSVSELPSELPHGSPVDCSIQLTFRSGEIVRPMIVPAEVRLLERHERGRERTLIVKADFEIIPIEIDVPRSHVLFMGYAERIHFHLHFVASSIHPTRRY